MVDTLPGPGATFRTKHRRQFVWDGREADGRLAPDGIYYVRVSLVHQGRYVLIANQGSGKAEPVTVQTKPPRLVVTGVTPKVISAPGTVTIHYGATTACAPGF